MTHVLEEQISASPPVIEHERVFDREEFIRDYHLRVIEPEGVTFNPSEYDLEYLVEYGVDKEKLRKFIEGLIDFVNLPIILDDFGSNHEQRRAFRDSMAAKFGYPVAKFFLDNKIRTNKLNNLCSHVEMLAGVYLRNAPVTNQIVRALRQASTHLRFDGGAYSFYSEDLKLAFTREFDLVARNLLHIFKK